MQQVRNGNLRIAPRYIKCTPWFGAGYDVAGSQPAGVCLRMARRLFAVMLETVIRVD